MKNSKPILKSRIILGEGYIGIDPDDLVSIRLYTDYDGDVEIQHNIDFINAINQTHSKYRVVLEKVK